MNIVFISEELPFPCNSGGRIYTWERLKQLKKNNNSIYLFSFKNKDELIESSKLKEVCTGVKVYERKNKYLKGIFHLSKPFSVISRFNFNMYNDIKSLISEKNIDLIIIDIPEVILNCPLDNNINKVVTQHNIEYEVFNNIAHNSENIIKKLIYKFEGYKMMKFEEGMYNKNIIKGYTFISEDDKCKLENLYDLERCICVPQGYDIKVGTYDKALNKKIVFTGTMDYEPNVQAVKWFVKDILPIVQTKVENVEFYIVGKNPTKDVLDLQKLNNSIIVTGKVDKVEPYLQQAHLCVIPLRSGGGVKIKLFEAIGNRNIVITTSKGVEGTLFENNRHLIVEDSAENFAYRCIEILKNFKKYEYMIDEGINLIKENYSWDSIGKKYVNFLSVISNL